MHKCYANERITFLHDDGPQFLTAFRAYTNIKEDALQGTDQFVSFAPMNWQDWHLLQPADMVAYDSFKVIDKRLHYDPDAVRKSLETLVGKRTPIFLSYTKPGGLKELYEYWQANQ